MSLEQVEQAARDCVQRGFDPCTNMTGAVVEMSRWHSDGCPEELPMSTKLSVDLESGVFTCEPENGIC